MLRIKDISNKLNRYKLRNRWIFAYILLSFVTTLILSLTLYQVMSGAVIERIGENSLLSLKQSAYESDTLVEQVRIVSSQMFVDRDLQNFIYAKEEDKVVTFRASLALSRILSVYPFVQSVELYNPRSNVYFSTLHPDNNETAVLMKSTKDLYKRLQFENGFNFPKRIDITKIAASSSALVPVTYQVLSFVFKPQTSIGTDSIVMINLDLDSIQGNILSYSTHDAGSQTLMLDSDNKVIVSSQRGQFLQDMSDLEYIGLLSGKAEGYAIRSVAGVKSLVCYTRSRLESWHFVSVTPYADLVGGLATMQGIVLLASVLTFLLALAIYILMTRSIYNPFKRLLNRLGGVPSSSNDIELLTKAITKNLWYRQNMESHGQELFLHELLSGMQDPSLDDESRADISRQFKAERYRLVLVQLDDDARLKTSAPQETYASYLFNLARIMHEVVSTRFVCCSVADESGVVTLVCGRGVLEGFPSLFAEIREIFSSLFHLSISAAVGNEVNAVDEVNALECAAATYPAVKARMRYRLFVGHGCLLDEYAVQPFLMNDASYPYEIEAELARGIRASDIAAVEAGAGELAAVLKASSCANVYNYAAQFVYSLLKLADSAGIVKFMPYEFIESLNSTDTVDGIAGQLAQLACELARANRNALMLKGSKKHSKVIDRIKAFVEANYSDSGLCLESVSGVVKLSPEYVRKFFKQAEGVSFSYYLTDLRLNKARELMLSTDMTIQQIGEHVGLTNPSYFFTLFKKAYGTTPSYFREQYRDIQVNKMDLQSNS